MEGSKEVAIVDASVVVKWFVQEKYTKDALRLRDDYRRGRVDVWSVQLMPYEVLNALRYNPEFGQGELDKAAKALSTYKIALYPLLEDLGQLSTRNALRYGISVYDAAYISLGEFLRKEAYTADDRLLSKVKDAGVLHHITDYKRVSQPR